MGVRVRFCSAYSDAGLAFAAVFMGACDFFLLQQVPTELAARNNEGLTGFVTITTAWTLFTLLLPFGIWWNHVSFIEVEGDRVRFRVGFVRGSESLKDAVKLEGGAGTRSFIVHFRNGRTVTCDRMYPGCREYVDYVENYTMRKFE